jgi:lipoprotein-releasing system ATP-binding protein
MGNQNQKAQTSGNRSESLSSLPDENFIVIQNLCKKFQNAHASIEILKNVNMIIENGETLSVVGASGIGKSTFLHILGTLDRPDQGKVLFQGEDIFSYDSTKLAKFRNEFIGFMFQFHHLLPEFTALENAMMPALIRGQSKQNAKKAAAEILVRVGLKDRLYHRVGKLSGGEQQRVALARALVLKPRILLADEPTGNLDRRNSDQVHELLLALNKEFSMTLIVVTHNMQLASYLSRCVTIIDGQIVEKNLGISK